MTDRRTFLGAAACGLAASTGLAQPEADYALPREFDTPNGLSVVLGRAGDTDVTASLLARDKLEAVIEYGTEAGRYTGKSKPVTLPAGEPMEVTLADLTAGQPHFYRVLTRKPGETAFTPRPEGRFHTRRPAGAGFTFCVQGDSHPERPQMSDPALYARTLRRAAADLPDLYLCMGDDFSVNKVRSTTAEALAAPYRLQRPFLGQVGQTASVYLVNGNHEQASRFNFNQKDERHQVAVGVQTARNRFFPLPAPGGIYTGDPERLDGIGLLRDYYAWTWGDALFVVLDNYWHSPAQVDTGYRAGAGKSKDDRKGRDLWAVTLGDAQNQWLRETLAKSTARYVFVFAHHVMGTGRGGVEASTRFEWGGQGDEFKRKRPGWELPVHQLMARHKVGVFFQGHDHLFCAQQRDGLVYQEVPLPADHRYATHNADAYTTGTKLPNAGYLRVSVAPSEAVVEYVRCWLPKDEAKDKETGTVAHRYTLKPRA